MPHFKKTDKKIVKMRIYAYIWEISFSRKDN
jgi:hypothetical protein